MAPPLGLARPSGRSRTFSDQASKTGAKLVDLEDVDIPDLHPGSAQHRLGRADRAGQHDDRVGAGDGERVTRARGTRPYRSTAACEAISSAAAPSEICDATAAVISQPSRSGARPAIFFARCPGAGPRPG